jgi:hypothetical protein
VHDREPYNVVKHYWITILHALQKKLSYLFKKLWSIKVTISQGLTAVSISTECHVQAVIIWYSQSPLYLRDLQPFFR